MLRFKQQTLSTYITCCVWVGITEKLFFLLSSLMDELNVCTVLILQQLSCIWSVSVFYKIKHNILIKLKILLKTPVAD